MIALLFATTALAYVDPECADLAAEGPPADYSEQGQQDFLLNYFAMALTFSPLHSPSPYASGHGSVGLELAVIPPLGCERRLVLSYTKTEDTNKAPVAPRPRLHVALPGIGKKQAWVPYVGLAYIPPVTVFSTTNVVVSTEVGIGRRTEAGWQYGARFHDTLMKTVAEIATPFVEGDPEYLDFYMGSTFGVDGMIGYKAGKITPYLALGFTDASTFFFIGDDNVVGNNLDPYQGFVAALGAQGRIKKIDLAGELYAAPGVIVTGRLRAGLRF